MVSVLNWLHSISISYGINCYLSQGMHACISVELGEKGWNKKLRIWTVNNGVVMYASCWESLTTFKPHDMMRFILTSKRYDMLCYICIFSNLIGVPCLMQHGYLICSKAFLYIYVASWTLQFLNIIKWFLFIL